MSEGMTENPDSLAQKQALIYSRELSQLYKKEKEKTRELASANRKLEKYAKELETSHEELARFLFIASHDLQEPVRKIHAFAGLLEQACVEMPGSSCQGREHLLRIKKSVAQLHIRIEQLTEYSAVASQEIQSAPVSLDALTRELADLYADPLASNDASLHRGRDLPTVHGDHRLLLTLFGNMLENSLKFRRTGLPLEIKIRLAVTNDDATWRIVFSDNGRGFDNHYREKIFEPFFRLESGPDSPGGGMGLAICRKIAARFNAGITADGEVEKGASFEIAFPRLPA